jgi:hypothetical protein
MPLPGGSSPLGFLASPRRGYFCPHCDYTTDRWDVLLRHFRETQCRKERKPRDYLSCSVQGWASFGRNARKTWRLDGVAATGQREAMARASWDQSVLDDPAIVALLQMEDKEEARLLREEKELMSPSTELEHDENTDWLRGCGWPRWFANKPLHLIIATSRVPPASGEAVHLGTWDGMDWISCTASETKLRQSLEVIALVLDRCEETFRQTPRVMRCWLRSWGSHFYAYLFELPRRGATRSRYRSFLNRFLCYVFRSWQLCQTLGRSLGEEYGLELSEVQVQRMESVWSGLSAYHLNDAELFPSSGISEAVFQLLVMFWTDTSTDNVLEGKAIVHFSGVLGVHPYELAYRTAYDYTPYLSALLWVGRLIVLEYVLPLRAYTSLDVHWPARRPM